MVRWPVEITVRGGEPVFEGQNAVFTLSADRAPGADLIVDVVVERDGDFVASIDRGMRTIRLEADATSSVHVVPTLDGPRDEPDGSVILTVLESSSGAGYKIGEPSSATVQVYDNDSPNVVVEYVEVLDTGTNTGAATSVSTSFDDDSSNDADPDARPGVVIVETPQRPATPTSSVPDPQESAQAETPPGTFSDQPSGVTVVDDESPDAVETALRIVLVLLLVGLLAVMLVEQQRVRREDYEAAGRIEITKDARGEGPIS